MIGDGNTALPGQDSTYVLWLSRAKLEQDLKINRTAVSGSELYFPRRRQFGLPLDGAVRRRQSRGRQSGD